MDAAREKAIKTWARAPMGRREERGRREGERRRAGGRERGAEGSPTAENTGTLHVKNEREKGGKTRDRMTGGAGRALNV